MDVQKIYTKLYSKFGPQDWWPTAQSMKHGTRSMRQFEICVGAILTQNTAWKNVEKAISNLHAARVMNPDAISKMRRTLLAELIRPAGYFNQKAKKLKIFSNWFLKNKEVNREELLKIWGIGPETADSILLYAYNKPVFVVDAYTKRLCSAFGLNFKKYEECQKFFTASLPRSVMLYNEYHALIVAWGKMFGNKKTSAQALKLVGARR